MADEEIVSWISIDERSVSMVDEAMVQMLDKRIGEALEKFDRQMEDRLQAASRRAALGDSSPDAMFDRRMNMMMRYEARSFLRSAATGVIANEFGDELSGAQDSFLGRSVGNVAMATALSGPIGGIEALLFSVVQEAVRLQADYKREQEEMRKRAEEALLEMRKAQQRMEDEDRRQRERREMEDFDQKQRLREWAEEKGYDIFVRQLDGQLGGASE
jgi:hypothetical protein